MALPADRVDYGEQVNIYFRNVAMLELNFTLL